MYINEKEIWLVDLEPSKGIELQKIRPCLVLRKYSKFHFFVLPLTTKEKSSNIAYCLEGISFLKKDKNYINISQARTLDHQRFIRRFGELSKKRFELIQIKTAEVLQLLPQGASAHNSKL